MVDHVPASCGGNGGSWYAAWCSGVGDGGVWWTIVVIVAIVVVVVVVVVAGLWLRVALHVCFCFCEDGKQ